VSQENPYTPPSAIVASPETEPELASRWARLGGAILDVFVLALLYIPVMYAAGMFESDNVGKETPTQMIQQSLGILLLFLIINGFLLAKRNQTIGKLLVKTQIVSAASGERLSFGKIYGLRYLFFHLLSIPAPWIGLVDSLFIFRNDKRCLHDLLAGTKVVRKDLA